MTTFHLVRHAEKAAPADVLTGRASGVHLTPYGREQATQLARHFAAHDLAAVYTSPRERAAETAAPIAASHGLEVGVRADFDEFDFGDWTGRSFGSLAPDPLWRTFNTARSTTRVPGGETMTEVQTRFVAELFKLVAAHPAATVIVVSHADPIRAALAYFVGAPLDCWLRFAVDIASIATVEIGDATVRLTALNVAASADKIQQENHETHEKHERKRDERSAFAGGALFPVFRQSFRVFRG